MRTAATLALLLLCQLASAQTKEKARQQFLDALNKLVANTTSQHWAYEEPFTVDSAFHLNGDTITATFRFTSDTIDYRIRYAAPIEKLKSVDHDVYLIMVFPAKNVQMYEQLRGDKYWRHFDSRNLFHIGLVETDAQQKLKEEVDNAWIILKQYYKWPFRT